MRWRPWQRPATDKLGIVMATHELTWARVAGTASAPHLVSAGKFAINNLEPAEALQRLISTEQLAGCHTHLVLPSGNYQLFLLEAPSVAEEELREAVRWRMSDMLTYPVTEAVLDAFLLPEDAYRGRQKMAYIAACPKKLISSLDFAFQGLSVSLDSITIPEVALLALGRHLIPENESWALVALGGNESHLCIIQHQSLYLARQAPVGWNRLHNSMEYDTLLLEVQRSLDFYDSQIGKGTVRRVLISSSDNTEPLLKYLQENLGPQVLQLTTTELVGTELPLDAPDSLQALGAALRGMSC